MTLVLTRGQVADMIGHVRRGLPYEGCGLLGGKRGRVTSVYPTRNSDPKANRFLVDPHDQYRAMVLMDTRGEELIGIFHSHPGGEPYPSERDCQLAGYPGVVHVIIAIGRRARMRVFLLDGGRVTALRLLVLGNRAERERREYVVTLPEGSDVLVDGDGKRTDHRDRGRDHHLGDDLRPGTRSAGRSGRAKRQADPPRQPDRKGSRW